jgi:hypothetical protein
MEFLKIISDDSSIELIPLSKVFSMKITMGKLYINGENKHLKVEKSEEFLNTYAGIIAEEMSRIFYTPTKISRILCIKNIDGYAKIFVKIVNGE